MPISFLLFHSVSLRQRLVTVPERCAQESHPPPPPSSVRGARWPAPLHSPSLTAPTLPPSPAGNTLGVGVSPSNKGDVEHDFPFDITCHACGTTIQNCPTTFPQPGKSVRYTYTCGGKDHCPGGTCDKVTARYLVASSIRPIANAAGGLDWQGWHFQKG